MPTFALTVSLVLKEGAEAEAERHLHGLALHSRQEPGCLIYNVHRSPSDPRRVLIYELYRDEAALQAHHATPHFAAHAVGGLYPLVASREAATYDALDAVPV